MFFGISFGGILFIVTTIYLADSKSKRRRHPDAEDADDDFTFCALAFVTLLCTFSSVQAALKYNKQLIGTDDTECVIDNGTVYQI